MNYLLSTNAAEARTKQDQMDNFSKIEKKGKRIKIDKNPIQSKNSKVNSKYDNNKQLAKIDQELEEEISLKSFNSQKSFERSPGIRYDYEEKIWNSRKYHTKRSGLHKRSKHPYSFLRKTLIKSNDQTELRNSHVASSKYGLTVILNPNEAEYTNAVKNNFIGFKITVNPYLELALCEFLNSVWSFDFIEVFLRNEFEYLDFIL